MRKDIIKKYITICHNHISGYPVDMVSDHLIYDYCNKRKNDNRYSLSNRNRMHFMCQHLRKILSIHQEENYGRT